MPRSPAIHYAGALRIVRGNTVTRISAGYAACCSGPRAEAIRARGNHTHDEDKVTCKRCLKAIAQSGVTLEGWALEIDGTPYDAPETTGRYLTGRVYGHHRYQDGTRVETSWVTDARGRRVQTMTGTAYLLGEPSAKYVQWLAKRGDAIDPEQPIRMVSRV